jgi:hypothetical protein
LPPHLPMTRSGLLHPVEDDGETHFLDTFYMLWLSSSRLFRQILSIRSSKGL